MMKKSQVAITIAVFITVLGISGTSQALLTRDRTSWGTGTYLDGDPNCYCGSSAGSLIINEFVGLSTETEILDPGYRQAIAIANPTNFSLGIRAVDLIGGRGDPEAGALAGSGMSIFGPVGDYIPATFQFDGSVTSGSALGGDGFALLWITDFNGLELAYLAQFPPKISFLLWDER